MEAILAGQRDAAVLAGLRQPQIHADEETIRKSLGGDWRREHLFTLRQSWEIYREYVGAIEACDREICEMLGDHEPRVNPEEKPLPSTSKPPCPCGTSDFCENTGRPPGVFNGAAEEAAAPADWRLPF